MKRYCCFIILGLFASVIAFAQFSDEDISISDFVTEVRPVTIPIFNPESDHFFGNEFQNAFIRGKSRRFTFVSLYSDMFKIPDDLVTHESGNKNRVIRYAASVGGMRPINGYLSGMAGVGVVRDNVYVADSWNYFMGGGVFAHYAPWGIGVGLMGGYYQNRYRELTLDNDGFYYGNIDAQPEKTTRGLRFMIVPRLSLSDKVFFLDELSANVGLSENADALKILSRLAFSAIQIGAARFGMDVYYNQYKYNMLLDQRAYGVRFDSKYLSFDIGYRQFLNTSGNPFAANYEDGMFGRIIVKAWVGIDRKNNQKVPFLFSYGFERTFGMRHFLGFGLQVGRNRMAMDSIIEANLDGDLRWGGVMPYK